MAILALTFFVASIFAHQGQLASLEPNAYSQKAIDISVWQSSFNGWTAKNAGLYGVICRASYSTSKDSMFDAFMSQAANNGLMAGAYMFATWQYASVSGSYDAALANARYQANYFVSLLQSSPANWYAALDLEYESGQTTVLSGSQIVDCINAFCDIVSNAGYRACLYSGASLIFDSMSYSNIRYPLWVAYYWRYGTALDFSDHDGSFPNTNYGRYMQNNADKIAMWQFTSEGYGSKYGCGSTNLDKDYVYQP